MKRHPVSFALAALAATLSLSTAAVTARPAAAQTPRYILTELKPWSTDSESSAWAINNRGLAVGHSLVRGSRLSADQYRTVLWDPNKQYAPEALAPLPGHEDAYAEDVNNHDQVIGRSFTTGKAVDRSFLYLPQAAYGLAAGMHNLNDLIQNVPLQGKPATETLTFSNWVTAINDHGQIVGNGVFRDAAGYAHARACVFDLRDRSFYYLHPAGVAESNANDVNNHGQVAISADGAAYVWEAGVGLQPVAGLSGAESINNPPADGSGVAQVISNRAIWDNGQVTSFGTLGGSGCLAWSINDMTQVVGDSNTASGSRRAFLWERTSEHPGGIMRDLNDPDLSDAAAKSLTLTIAFDINNAVQARIAGMGHLPATKSKPGLYRAFVLTPR
jgi:probable HAF family extracellular repeat protein